MTSRIERIHTGRDRVRESEAAALFARTVNLFAIMSAPDAPA